MTEIQTQKEEILIKLLSGKKITMINGWREIGCSKTNSRISDLRLKDGWKDYIQKEWIQVTNRYGRKVNVMQYSL